MSQYRTIAEALAGAAQSWPENGFTFQDGAGKETRFDFPQVLAEADRRAAALQAMGLGKGDRFGLIVIEPQDFVLTFLGALRVGILPVPLYPPLSFGSLDAYTEKTGRILESAGARVLVASEKLQNILWSLVGSVPSLERLVRAEDLSKHVGAPKYPEILPEDLAFLQYTSGSTSDPKGVMVSHASLIANCDGIMNDGIETSSKDVGVSWLPLYHDMGLIGFVIAPITMGVSIVYIPTLRFLRRPNSWMDTIHRHRGTLTFAPNFAYALAARKAKPSDIEKWDLSSLRAAGCGAEPIHPDTMSSFLETFASCGLKRTAMLPCYGMAEATLAISFIGVDEEVSTNVVDAEAFQERGLCEPVREGQASFAHVSCGRPFPKHDVGAFNDAGERNPEGMEGELWFRGPSVTPGYYKNPEATAECFRPDGWLRTGDLGYVLHGNVYVTGRMKDLIILNGRNLHPQAIEWVAAEVEGVRKGNVVAFSRPGASSEELVVVFETRATERDELAAAVKLAVQREHGIAAADVVCLEVGTLPKTSSGKLQRRKTRDMYLRGALGLEGSRDPASTASKVTLARHVAKSVWTRARTAVLSR